MQCLECGRDQEQLDNEHLLACCGLTVQEYAIRHHLPLDLLLHPGQVNVTDDPAAYPTVVSAPGERARAVLLGLRWAGRVKDEAPFVEIPGEVRRLDLLLWDLEQLNDFGFCFRQQYRYGDSTHRVVARNCLRAPAGNLTRARLVRSTPEPPPDFFDALAVYLTHAGEYQAGYLFMQFALAQDGRDVAERLRREHSVVCVELDAADQPQGVLLRTYSPADALRLLNLLRGRLEAMPEGWTRFCADMPEACVTKELVFDSAHFITDHPAKCSNLHGGRYLLQVQVAGRIDPATGCVVDYGYLKRVVNRQVVERFDHHHLNYATPELAWRSSTEMICVHVWERLIDYLPGMAGLRLYETTQSWCDYRGPGLEEYQQRGSCSLLTHFRDVKPDARRVALSDGRRERLLAVGT